MFDDKLLLAFARTFYGYGNFDASVWFVGMEEGGGNFDEISRRLAAWNRRGRSPIEDVRDFHLEFGEDRNFRDIQPSIQRTWRGIILAVLASAGREEELGSVRETIRQYQRQEFARWSGNICSLELLPLPSANLETWIYGDHSKLPYLETRQLYKEHFLPKRIKGIIHLIKKHTPRIVIFYGSRYAKHWAAIMGGEFEVSSMHRVLTRTEADRSYIAIPHPTSRGLTTSFFIDLGRMIRSLS